jgi:hypothetical protein
MKEEIKDAIAAYLSRRGRAANRKRNENLTADEREAIARKAAKKRWAAYRKAQKFKATMTSQERSRDLREARQIVRNLTESRMTVVMQ